MSVPLLFAAIFIPTTPTRLCEHVVSFNSQTVLPHRIVIGILGYDTVNITCINKYHTQNIAPVRFIYKRGKGSPGGSRNLALSVRRRDEIAILLDDDDVAHPQTVEYILHIAKVHTDVDIITSTYVYNWQGVGSPFCLGDFKSITNTRLIKKNTVSTNIRAYNLSLRCAKVVHGNPTLVTRTEEKYSETTMRGEDGKYLKTALDNGRRILHTCFPIIAYKGVAHNTRWSNSTCECYGGFATCV